MPKVIFLPHTDVCPEGLAVDASEGDNLLLTALNNGVELEHACGGVGVCSTCHINVVEGFDSLNPPSESEEDMLDSAWGLSIDSRLACQCTIGKEDLVIEVPKYSKNHAKEVS